MFLQFTTKYIASVVMVAHKIGTTYKLINNIIEVKLKRYTKIKLITNLY